MKTAAIPVALIACLIAGCTTGTDTDRLTVNEKTCIRALEELSNSLGTPRRRLSEESPEIPTFEFYEIAAQWSPGDRPIDVRRWVDDARLIQRIMYNCGSPETSVLVPIGGRTKIVDITVRPVPYERPARRGDVEITELPVSEPDEAVEELQD